MTNGVSEALRGVQLYDTEKIRLLEQYNITRKFYGWGEDSPYNGKRFCVLYAVEMVGSAYEVEKMIEYGYDVVEALAYQLDMRKFAHTLLKCLNTLVR